MFRRFFFTNSRFTGSSGIRGKLNSIKHQEQYSLSLCQEWTRSIDAQGVLESPEIAMIAQEKFQEQFEIIPKKL